jgi:hypothetical protein
MGGNGCHHAVQISGKIDCSSHGASLHRDALMSTRWRSYQGARFCRQVRPRMKKASPLDGLSAPTIPYACSFPLAQPGRDCTGNTTFTGPTGPLHARTDSRRRFSVAPVRLPYISKETSS